jgi:hypothetical protein
LATKPVQTALPYLSELKPKLNELLTAKLTENEHNLMRKLLKPGSTGWLSKGAKFVLTSQSQDYVQGSINNTYLHALRKRPEKSLLLIYSLEKPKNFFSFYYKPISKIC